MLWQHRPEIYTAMGWGRNCSGQDQFNNRKKISELCLEKKLTNCHSNCFVDTKYEFFKSFQEQLIFLKIKSKYVYKFFIYFQNVY